MTPRLDRDLFLAALAEALAGLPVAVSAAQRAALQAHWNLVTAWNTKVNLTSITDPTQAAWLHYRDSLQPIEVLGDDSAAAPSLADMGSGAGFPGLPLAIVTGRPTTLVEPRRKRASFLRTVVASLGLRHVRVVEARSSDPPPETFSCAVTRATFSDAAGLRSCARWLAPDGRLVALRAAGAEPPLTAPRRLDYELLGRPRVLEIWTREDLSGP